MTKRKKGSRRARRPRVVPDAVLDTNVSLAIYSWHDLILAVEAARVRDSKADLTDPEIQFRAQRARSAFLLTLFLHENSWITIGPLNELLRTLRVSAPPKTRKAGIRSNFVRFFLYFIKDKLLTKWRFEADASADRKIKSNDVDRLCLDWAAQHKVPLISWEGHGPRGLDRKRLIPKEAAARGIDHVSPEELLYAKKFDEQAAIKRFSARWDKHINRYVTENPKAKETVAVLRHFYWRLAKNDWTP